STSCPRIWNPAGGAGGALAPSAIVTAPPNPGGTVTVVATGLAAVAPAPASVVTVVGVVAVGETMAFVPSTATVIDTVATPLRRVPSDAWYVNESDPTYAAAGV